MAAWGIISDTAGREQATQDGSRPLGAALGPPLVSAHLLASENFTPKLKLKDTLKLKDSSDSLLHSCAQENFAI